MSPMQEEARQEVLMMGGLWWQRYLYKVGLDSVPLKKLTDDQAVALVRAARLERAARMDTGI